MPQLQLMMGDRQLAEVNGSLRNRCEPEHTANLAGTTNLAQRGTKDRRELTIIYCKVPASICTGCESLQMRRLKGLIASKPASSALPNLPNGPVVAKDLVHFLRADVERQVADVEDAVHLRRQPLGRAGRAHAWRAHARGCHGRCHGAQRSTGEDRNSRPRLIQGTIGRRRELWLQKMAGRGCAEALCWHVHFGQTAPRTKAATR